MLHKFRSSLLGVAAAIVSFTSLSADAAQQYKITDIGVLPGGGETWTYAINDMGAVVGYGSSSEGNRAFLWSGSSLSNLGALPGAFTSSAHDINNAGTVVGSSNSKAIIWQQGSMSELNGLPNASYSHANGINQSGQVIGTSEGQAVVWNQGQIKPLGTLSQGWVSVGLDINDSGASIGTAYSPSYHAHAMLWAASTSTVLIGLAGSTDSGAIALNNAGVVVGYSGAANRDQAVAWENGAARLLAPVIGGAGGRAYDINDDGQIVGFSDFNSTFHATSWQDGQAYDLNDWLVNGQGWFLEQALSINASGQIAGVGFIGSQIHAYVLTPIPEPSSLALMGVGLLSLTLTRRRSPKASGPTH